MGREPESSEVAFEGHVFSVVREVWPEFGHGYDVVRAFGAAAVLPVTPNGDVLLVEQFRPAIRQTIVEIPAGLLDVNGEDPAACAARELFEETGYRHVSIEPLGGMYTTAGFSDEYVHLFRATTEVRPSGRPEAGIELVRRPLSEMSAAARAGRVQDAKTALALLMADPRS